MNAVLTRTARRSLWLALLLPLLMLMLQEHTSSAAAANVAVLMSANVEAYQEALKGFKAAVDHRVVAEYEMAGNPDAGRKALAEIRAKVKPDLILVVGTFALQLAIEAPFDVPVIYTMVLNPPSVIGEEKRNMTGASMNVPVRSTMDLAKKLGPQIRRVGVVFNQAKTGYLIKQAEAAAREEGLQLVAKEIGSSREAIGALSALQETGIDALWIPPDETILAPEVVQQILLVSYDSKLPVIGLSLNQAQLGAIVSQQFSSGEDIGKQAAELANAVLKGHAASELPYTSVRQVSVIVNLKAAEKLGVPVPQSILGIASNVIQ